MIISDLPMNLQFFAEETGGGSGDATGGNPPAPSNQQSQNPNSGAADDSHKEAEPNNGHADDVKIPKGYHSDAEVDKIVQEKIARQKAKDKAAQDEAQKMANMDAEQRYQYKIDKLTKENTDLKGYKSKSKMTSTARKMASEDGIELRDEDLKHVVTADADSTKANLDWVKGLRSYLYDQVKKELLSGSAPKVSGSSLSGKTSNYGASLAKKTAVNVKNPYFNNSKQK